MDTAILTALVKGQLAIIATIRQSESTTRDAISGYGIEAMAQSLFPGVDTKLLSANKDVPNYLQQGAARYVRAMNRGILNWEWAGAGDAPTRGNPGLWLNPRGRDLVQDSTTDALVSGKFAFFPHIGPDGKFRVTTLNGFLWPIYAQGDVSDVQAVLQVTAGRVEGQIRYQVRRYSAGLLEVFSNLEDWQKYATAVTPEIFPQPHAAGRLPVAFRVVGRDANREAEGLVQTAMPAYRRYVKFAVLLAFIATRGGFEERVVKSTWLANLIEKDPNSDVLKELKKVGINTLRVLDAGADYLRLAPVALSEYREQEMLARADVQDALNMPDINGANLSGDALAEKREAFSETVESIASSVADALSEAQELGAGLSRELNPDFRVTLKPRFTRDVAAERKALLEDYKAGGFPKSAYLSRLQSLGISEITDAMVQAALDQEEADLIPSVPVNLPTRPPSA